MKKKILNWRDNLFIKLIAYMTKKVELRRKAKFTELRDCWNVYPKDIIIEPKLKNTKWGIPEDLRGVTIKEKKEL